MTQGLKTDDAGMKTGDAGINK